MSTKAMGKKLISVIMPVYNREMSLRRAAEAVLSQSYEPLELILVDDGSTDGSRDICRKLSEIHDNVISIRQENKGPAAARNRGLAAAAGEYIAFADSDDSLSPFMYERLAAELEQTGADIALCGFAPIKAEASEGIKVSSCRSGGEIKKIEDTCGSSISSQDSMAETISKTASTTNNTSASSKDALRSDWETTNSSLKKAFILSEKPEMFDLITDSKRPFGWGIWNKLYRRELIGDLRFNEELHINEDLEFNLSLFSRAASICFTKDRLYYYDDSSSGLSKQISPKPYLAAMKVIEGILEGDNVSAEVKFGKKACDNLRVELLNQGLMALEVMLLSEKAFSGKEQTGKEQAKEAFSDKGVSDWGLTGKHALYIKEIFKQYGHGNALKSLRPDQKPLVRSFCHSERLFKLIYYAEMPIKRMLGGGVIYRRLKNSTANQSK